MARLAAVEAVKPLDALELDGFCNFLNSAALSANPYSQATIDRYVRSARYFIEYAKMQGLRDLEEVNGAWLRAYLFGKGGAGKDRFSASTRIVQQSALQALWFWAQDNGYAIDNPLEQLTKERQQDRKRLRGGRRASRLPKVLSWEQQDALLAAALDNPRRDTCARDYLMVMLLLATGLRKEEICSLRLADFRPEEGTLRVVGKGDKERLVRYDGAEVLPAWHQYKLVREGQGIDVPELLVTRTGKALTGNLVYQQVSGYLAKLGDDLPAQGPHLLRHTAASRQLAMGVPITTVQANLGHSSLRTLEIYAHLLPPRKAA